jgi:hypothetical protein
VASIKGLGSVAGSMAAAGFVACVLLSSLQALSRAREASTVKRRVITRLSTEKEEVML